MLASLGTWLSKLDPNVVVPIVVSALVYAYHVLLSPSARAKIAAAVNDAIQLADRALATAVALAPAGTTEAQLEGDLLAIAKAQLAHAGLDPDKLPPVVLALVKALVAQAVAGWKATQTPPTSSGTGSVSAPVSAPVSVSTPAPQAVPIVTIPPSPPATSTGSKGCVRVSAMLAVAGLAVGTGIAGVDLSGCAAVQKMTAPFEACVSADLGKLVTVNGVAMDVESAVSLALAGDVAGIPAALAAIALQLVVTAATDTVDCAISAIESDTGLVVGSGSGTGAAAAATSVLQPVPTRAQRIAAGRTWVAAQRAAKK
jgi:hypothetical protein